MKKYIQPAIEIHEVQFQQMVATSIGLDNDNKYTGNGKNLLPGMRNPFGMTGFGGGFDNPFED